MQPPRVSSATASQDDYSAHPYPCRQNFPRASTFSRKSTCNYPTCSYIREWWISLVALVVLQVIQLPKREGLRKPPWVGVWQTQVMCPAPGTSCNQGLLLKHPDWGYCCSAEHNISNKHSQQRLLWAWHKTETFLKFKKKARKKQLPSTLCSSDIKTVLFSIKI